MQKSKDRWIKCISTDGTIRGVAIQATGLIQSLASMHGLEGVHARSLGESMMGAVLLASYCKTGERVNLNIRGSGHASQALVDAYPDGTVRGYVIPRELGAEFLGESGELGIWGSGLLSVLRTKGGEGKQPYIGTVPLVTGHLAKDLTFYWVQSEQVPSAVGLGVKMDGTRVVAAGGFLVQAMPEATAEHVSQIERHIHEIQSLADAVSHDEDPVGLLSHIFQSMSFMLLEEKPIEFRCNCSQERVERALALVGTSELNDMLEKDGQATVRCDFCVKEYRLDRTALRGLVGRLAEKTLKK